MCGLWWTKRHWGRFSPSTSVSPANHHFTNFSIIIIIIIITRGWHNRPTGGRSAVGTQLDSTPPLYQLKKALARPPIRRYMESELKGAVKYLKNQ
jgi:hypothetical protein